MVLEVHSTVGSLLSLNFSELTTGKGCLTQYRLFKESDVIKTPSYLSDFEACNLSIAGTTAWMAINGMRPIGQPGGAGETILVQGTGGVSIMGLLIAKASGARGKEPSIKCLTKAKPRQ